MQQGIVSPEAASIAGKAGIAVVEDLCIMVEHKRLLGN
ncbi:MAG: CoA-binding protein [Bilophila wadsworthia]|jgi:predicted CoA-binding protein